MIGEDCLINPASRRAVKASGKIGQRILASRRKANPSPAPTPKQSPQAARIIKSDTKLNINNEEFEIKYTLDAFKKLRQPFNLSFDDGKNAYKVKAYIFRNNAENFSNKIKKLYSKLTDAEKTANNTDLLRSIVNDDYFKEIDKYYKKTTK
jgi:hypothetical protein